MLFIVGKEVYVRKIKIFVICFGSFVILGLCTPVNVNAIDPTDKIYFTKANIWYVHPEKIYSTNYHEGSILPVGTKVKIAKFSKDKIKFVVDQGKGVFTYIRISRHCTISREELFERYFSVQSVMAPGGPFHKLTKKEQANIKNGTISLGMRKEAVLMAYGYPPSHKTPTLSSNVWVYWEGRRRKVNIFFKDDRVVEIK